MTTESQLPKSSSMSQIKATVFFRAYELFFFGLLVLQGYWIFTLNFKWIAICIAIIILSSLVNDRWIPYCRFIANHLQIPKFFKIRRYYQEEVPEEEKTMFSFHPHGVYAYGVLMNLNHPNFPNQKLSRMTGLSSRFMLSLPVFGFLFRIWGLQSVDPKNLKRMMKRGRTLGIVPGGYEQATITTPNQMRFFINNRLGFIKYALKYGYTLRPVIVMNEHKAFSTLDVKLKWRLFLNKLKIPAVIYWCRYWIAFPPNIPMHTVVGKGIKSEKVYGQNQDPTKQQVANFHSIYKSQLMSLYEKHKEKNGGVPLMLF